MRTSGKESECENKMRWNGECDRLPSPCPFITHSLAFLRTFALLFLHFYYMGTWNRLPNDVREPGTGYPIMQESVEQAAQ